MLHELCYSHFDSGDSHRIHQLVSRYFILPGVQLVLLGAEGGRSVDA